MKAGMDLKCERSEAESTERDGDACSVPTEHLLTLIILMIDQSVL